MKWWRFDPEMQLAKVVKDSRRKTDVKAWQTGRGLSVYFWPFHFPQNCKIFFASFHNEISSLVNGARVWSSYSSRQYIYNLSYNNMIHK